MFVLGLGVPWQLSHMYDIVDRHSVSVACRVLLQVSNLIKPSLWHCTVWWLNWCVHGIWVNHVDTFSSFLLENQLKSCLENSNELVMSHRVETCQIICTCFTSFGNITFKSWTQHPTREAKDGVKSGCSVTLPVADRPWQCMVANDHLPSAALLPICHGWPVSWAL